MTKILILEDDDFIRQQLAGILQEKGYLVVEAASVGQFNNIYEQEEAVIDVFLLDVYLPDGNGFDVCRKIREHGSQIIIFLTSCDDEDSIIKGLDCGGDDYVTKPFSPREIVFRIKAQLRRQQYQSSTQSNSNDLLTVGTLTLDKESSRIYKAGQEIELTGREFFLLSYLMENANKIISKERLYEQVWGEYSSICDNTIMVHIRHIREKIEDTPSSPTQLVTVKGLGYKLEKRTN